MTQVKLDRSDQKVILEIQVYKDLKETKATLGLQDRKDPKAKLDRKERLDRKDLKVIQGHKVHRAYRVFTAYKERLDLKAKLDRRVWLVRVLISQLRTADILALKLLLTQLLAKWTVFRKRKPL